ncbi:MAG: hypothetical protein M9909_11120 [Thermomicrobiales bacterium]|nr:hypothetical protein [Thermomicrobiales bacterium]
MNRRVFVTTGAAAFALAATRIAAQVAETTYQTTLTGSSIDVGESGFTFGEPSIQDDVETIELIKGTAAAYIDFVPAIDDPEAFMEASIDEVLDAGISAELVDSGILDDGAWGVMSAQISGDSLALYQEVQLGAYPGFDLVISIRSGINEFEDVVADFQRVTVDGLAPFVFLEDTDAVNLVAAIVPATATSRTSRSSRASGTESTTTTRSSRSSRSASEKATTTDDDSYRESVRAHRLEFQETFLIFAQSLGILTDSTSSKSATDQALADIDGIADEWLLYPERFAEMIAPASESSLAGLYETWCDEIATLADTWNAARVGDASADDIFDQLDVVIDADDALGDELNAPTAARWQMIGLTRMKISLV